MSVRTCLICRDRKDKSSLLRFVRAKDGEICFDEEENINQRANWICANNLCLNMAFKKRVLFRAEKTLSLEPSVMMCHISSLLKKSILSRFILLAKIGQIKGGRNAVSYMLNKENACMLVFAKDISFSYKKDVFAMANSSSVPFIESNLIMEEIGSSLGRNKTGVVGLWQNRITNEAILRLVKLKGIH